MNVTGSAETAFARGSKDDELAEAIGRIAFDMNTDRIPAGDLAKLRRARFEDAAPAFWRAVMRHLEPAGLVQDEKDERRWLQILAGMAEMKGLHRRGERPGRALAEAEIAEARVLRLLRARGEALHSVLRGVVHQLATGRHRVDWTGLAELVLSDGEPEREEKARRRVARDYYRFESRRRVPSASEREG